jgi:hypothetical protein
MGPTMPSQGEEVGISRGRMDPGRYSFLLWSIILMSFHLEITGLSSGNLSFGVIMKVRLG